VGKREWEWEERLTTYGETLWRYVVQAENEDEGCIEFTAMLHSGPIQPSRPARGVDGRASAP